MRRVETKSNAKEVRATMLYKLVSPVNQGHEWVPIRNGLIQSHQKHESGSQVLRNYPIDSCNHSKLPQKITSVFKSTVTAVTRQCKSNITTSSYKPDLRTHAGPAVIFRSSDNNTAQRLLDTTLIPDENEENHKRGQFINNTAFPLNIVGHATVKRQYLLQSIMMVTNKTMRDPPSYAIEQFLSEST